MTKKQLDNHECNRTAQTKLADGLEQAYNFEDTHSVNPAAGQPDDGTPYTKTVNHSLRDTAYNVLVGDDVTEMDDIVAEPYKDKEGVHVMDLDIDQVHQDTGKQLQGCGAFSEVRAGTALKELQTSLTRPSELNKGCSISANGSRSGSLGHTEILLIGLAKTSLNANEAAPEQGQANNSIRVESLALANE